MAIAIVLTNSGGFCHLKKIRESMSFQIPAKAFLSFGKNQAVDTLWRFARQIEQKFEEESLNKFQEYLEVLKSHENSDVAALAFKLGKFSLKEAEEFQKVLACLERYLGKELADHEFLVSTADSVDIKTEVRGELHLVLDNLRSAFNIGSIFRSAEALGVTEIHLCGYTATPDNSKTAKSALGTDQWVKWTHWESSLDCLKELRERGIHTYALETSKKAIPLHECPVSFPAALVFGNERYGLGSPVLSKTDSLIKIDLAGRKNSLNVGVCAALAIHHFLHLA